MGAGCGQADASRYYLSQVFQKHRLCLSYQRRHWLFLVWFINVPCGRTEADHLNCAARGGLWGPLVSSHQFSYQFRRSQNENAVLDLCIDWGRYLTRPGSISKAASHPTTRLGTKVVNFSSFELSDVTERRDFVRRRMRDLYGFLIIR